MTSISIPDHETAVTEGKGTNNCTKIFDSEGVVHPTIGAKSNNYTRNSVQVFEETGTFPFEDNEGFQLCSICFSCEYDSVVTFWCPVVFTETERAPQKSIVVSDGMSIQQAVSSMANVASFVNF